MHMLASQKPGKSGAQKCPTSGSENGLFRLSSCSEWPLTTKVSINSSSWSSGVFLLSSTAFRPSAVNRAAISDVLVAAMSSDVSDSSGFRADPTEDRLTVVSLIGGNFFKACFSSRLSWNLNRANWLWRRFCLELTARGILSKMSVERSSNRPSVVGDVPSLSRPLKVSGGTVDGVLSSRSNDPRSQSPETGGVSAFPLMLSLNKEKGFRHKNFHFWPLGVVWDWVLFEA